jgi:mRNA deadenylase 3'-5' endonuclease subunit Ccr4
LVISSSPKYAEIFDIVSSYDFKGVIDYIFYSRNSMRTLGLLGQIDPDWIKTNKILGFPHPHVPSDHLPLIVELELFIQPQPIHQNILNNNRTTSTTATTNSNTQLTTTASSPSNNFYLNSNIRK